MAIPTAAAAAHSPARACRVLPRSVPNPGGEVTASHRICIPSSSHSVPAAADEM